MKVQIAGTYGKTRDFKEVAELPKIGEEWNGNGYENAKVAEIININDEIAETTAGDPKAYYDFYKVGVEYSGDMFNEYIAVEGGYIKDIEEE